MSTTPPDEPTGTPPGSTPPTPPSGPDYGAPPPSAPDYGASPPPPPGGYGAQPPGGYGAPPPPGGPHGYADDAWSVGNALTYGWKKFTQNVGSILLLALMVFLGSVVLGIVGSVIDRAILGSADPGSLRSTSTPVASLLGLIGQTVFGAVIVRGALDLTEGRRLQIGSLFGRINLGAVLLLAIVVGIIETIGLALCFLPGLIAMLFLYFATYFLLDRNIGALDAIKASFNLVRRDLGKALVWAIVALIVTFVGVCFCFVGLLVTIPVAIIGTAYTYKKLTGQPVAP